MNVLQGRPVPIFPLPNVVLFPRVLLPLYIFEPRYCSMLTDCLDGHGKIAMALLKPGWEPQYHAEPETHDVVCVGNIVNYRTREDGTSDLVLVGETRARIVEWVHGRQYRRAKLHPLSETRPVSVARKEALRKKLLGWSSKLLSADASEQLEQLQRVFADDGDPGYLVDLLASRLLEQPQERQTLLEELVVEKRALGLKSLLARQGLL